MEREDWRRLGIFLLVLIVVLGIGIPAGKYYYYHTLPTTPLSPPVYDTTATTVQQDAISQGDRQAADDQWRKDHPEYYNTASDTSKFQTDFQKQQEEQAKNFFATQEKIRKGEIPPPVEQDGGVMSVLR